MIPGSKSESEKEPKTHDLTKRYFVHDYAIQDISKAGAKLVLVIWYSEFIDVGDYLILQNKEGTTRYKADKVNYCTDPSDMMFVYASFAPRPEPIEQN